MRPHKKTKKTLIWLLGIVAVICCYYVYSAITIRHLNKNIIFTEAPSDTIVHFSLLPDCTFKSITGADVFVDMGSRHSFISQETLETMKRQNYKVEIKPILLYTADENGRYNLYTQKAIVDVELPNSEIPGNYKLKNVELLVSKSASQNVIGMDILSQFAIEFIDSTQEVRFYRQAPGDYKYVCDIDLHDTSFGTLLGSKNRASIKIAVNDEGPIDYFFDTGGRMRHFDLVQPTNMMSKATSEIVTDSIYGLNIQKHCRVSYGHRLKYGDVVYSDTLHTDKYSVNPLRLFDQDIVLDFPNARLLSHRK